MSKQVMIFFPDNSSLTVTGLTGKVMVSGDGPIYVKHFEDGETKVVAVVPKNYLVVVTKEKNDGLIGVPPMKEPQNDPENQ